MMRQIKSIALAVALGVAGGSNYAWILRIVDSGNFHRSINSSDNGQSVRPVRGFAK